MIALDHSDLGANEVGLLYRCLPGEIGILDRIVEDVFGFERTKCTLAPELTVQPKSSSCPAVGSQRVVSSTPAKRSPFKLVACQGTEGLERT